MTIYCGDKGSSPKEDTDFGVVEVCFTITTDMICIMVQQRTKLVY